MKHILVIFKKELKRFFFDRRMLLAMFLPGLLIFVAYTVMGNIMQSNLFSTAVKDTTYQIAYTDNYTANEESTLPKIVSLIDTYVKTAEKTNTVQTIAFSAAELDTYKGKLKTKECHLVIAFSDYFEDLIHTDTKGNDISLFYNGGTNASTNIYSIAYSLIQTAYDNYTTNYRDGQPQPADLGEKNIILQKVISFILPMVTVSMLYATITSFCPESISGEKERGTLATTLLTPIKRTEFIVGKIMALGVITVASGLSSYLGLMFSLPKMMGLVSTALPFGPLEIILLFLIVITSLLVFVSFGVLISSLTNTIKEAGSLLGPFTGLFMMLSIVPTLLGSAPIGFAFVPVMNLSACIYAILMQTPNLALLFGLTVASNLLYSAILVFVVAKLFNKEKVVLGH